MFLAIETQLAVLGDFLNSDGHRVQAAVVDRVLRLSALTRQSRLKLREIMAQTCGIPMGCDYYGHEARVSARAATTKIRLPSDEGDLPSNPDG